LRVAVAVAQLMVVAVVEVDLEQEPDLWYPLIPLTQLP
jgi:hypothetical protein